MSSNHQERLFDTRDNSISWDKITYGSYHDVSLIEHWLPYVLLLAGAGILWVGLIWLLFYYPNVQSSCLRTATYAGLFALPVLVLVLFLAYPDRNIINRSRIDKTFDGEFEAHNAAELIEEIKSKSLSESRLSRQ